MSTKTPYTTRLLKIAERKARKRYPNGTKDQLLIYQLGFVVGMLGRYSVNDIAIKQDIHNLEQELGIVYKD